MKQKMLDKFGDIKDKISNVFTDEKLQQKMTSIQYTFSELNQDTSTIPSLYYDTTSQKITKKNKWSYLHRIILLPSEKRLNR